MLVHSLLTTVLLLGRVDEDTFVRTEGMIVVERSSL